MLSTLPDLHRSFAEQLKLKFQSDSRIHSLLAGSSIVHGGFDKYSDLDFVVVVDSLHYDEIMAQQGTCRDIRPSAACFHRGTCGRASPAYMPVWP